MTVSLSADRVVSDFLRWPWPEECWLHSTVYSFSFPSRRSPRSLSRPVVVSLLCWSHNRSLGGCIMYCPCLSVCQPLCLSYALVTQHESRAVARKLRDAAAVLFGLKFADNSFITGLRVPIESQASELQTYRREKNLTQNDHSRSFKVTCFGVNGKAIRD